MVSSMRQMKFTPFIRGQRAQNGMVRQRFAATKARIALSDYIVHALNVLKDFCPELFERSSARQNALRRFATAGNKA